MSARCNGAQEKETALISRARLEGVGPPAEGGCTPPGREGPGSPLGFPSSARTSQASVSPSYSKGLVVRLFYTHDSLKILLCHKRVKRHSNKINARGILNNVFTQLSVINLVSSPTLKQFITSDKARHSAAAPGGEDPELLSPSPSL